MPWPAADPRVGLLGRRIIPNHGSDPRLVAATLPREAGIRADVFLRHYASRRMLTRPEAEIRLEADIFQSQELLAKVG
jgi:hypothetical protein